MRSAKRKKLYYSCLASIYIIAAAALTAGTAVVSVNCHNAVSGDRMVLFDIGEKNGHTVITVMDRDYMI